MKAFNFTVRGREEWDTEAYEPFDGAAFVVHRSRGRNGAWVVTHRGTTWIAHYPDDNTRRTGLAIAERLCAGCPSASTVAVEAGKLSGPHQKLRDEIVAVLKSMGETTRAAA